MRRKPSQGGLPPSHGPPTDCCRHDAISSLEHIPPIFGTCSGMAPGDPCVAKSVDSMDATKRSKTGPSTRDAACSPAIGRRPDPAERPNGRTAGSRRRRHLRLLGLLGLGTPLLCFKGPLPGPGPYASSSPGRHVRHRLCAWFVSRTAAGRAALPWHHARLRPQRGATASSGWPFSPPTFSSCPLCAGRSSPSLSCAGKTR